MVDEAHKQFLLGAGADKIRHSGRSLYEHLVGTHNLLEAWGNSKPVCDAGLFHSIYGTKHFRHKTWPLTDRATIRELIGSQAEKLAYWFCVKDPPRDLLYSINPVMPLFYDSHLNRSSFETLETLRNLREMAVANLLEQGSRSNSLRRLYDCDISDGAKRAIARHLRAADAPVSLRA